MFDNLVERSPGVGVCSPDPETHFLCSFWHFLTIFYKCKLLWKHHLNGEIHFLFCKESFQRGPLGMKYTWRTTNKIVWVIPCWVVKAELLPVGDLIKMFYQKSALSPITNNVFFPFVDCTDEKPLSVIPPTLQSANERFVHPVNHVQFLTSLNQKPFTFLTSAS